jgi:hypothetical protein
MAGFLAGIGLETAPVVFPEPGFLDGLMISHGVLFIDEARLAYPGDLLHEAGHLAVVPGERRKLLYGDIGSDPGEVFHSSGYSGGSQTILQNFSQERYFGVPMLEWLGLTADKKPAALLQVPPYPYMLKWLRD